MRAAIVGPSETIPLAGGRLATGTWQQVVLIDFDDRPRQRTVVGSSVVATLRRDVELPRLPS